MTWKWDFLSICRLSGSHREGWKISHGMSRVKSFLAKFLGQEVLGNNLDVFLAATSFLPHIRKDVNEKPTSLSLSKLSPGSSNHWRRRNCWNKWNLEKLEGGTLWTLLASRFRDHHEGGQRLKPSQEQKSNRILNGLLWWKAWLGGRARELSPHSQLIIFNAKLGMCRF